MDTAQIIEPGRYDYELQVKFDSYYIPEHTPPAFRNSAGYKTTRTRNVFGQFDLGERVDREVLREYLIKQDCDDLNGQEVEIVRFDLTPAA